MLYTLLLLMALTGVHYIDACSCLESHPQSLYCDADFVMQVRLRGPAEQIYKKEAKQDFDEESNIYQTFIDRRVIAIKYNVKIREIYKVNENNLGLNMNSTVASIYTGAHGAMCGVDLNEGTNYLLSGKYSNDALRIGLCNSIATAWPFVTKMQKKGLRFSYKQSCDCKIQNINFVDVLDPKACAWDSYKPFSSCYKRQTVCIHDKNSSTGGCKWQRNQRLKKCREDAKARRRLP